MKLSRIVLHAALALMILCGFAGSIVTAAASSGSGKSGSSSSSNQNSATGSGNIQNYASDAPLQIGSIVQLVGGATAKVAPATSKDLKQIYGVVVDPHKLSLTISDSSLANEVYVTTGGTYDVLVDTQNGVIKQGDFVTISALDGVGMKAGTYEDQAIVLGRAINGFDGKNNVLGSTTLKDSTGKTIPVSIGMIQVSINVGRNTNEKSTKTNLPPFLQRIGQAIAEKPIGPLRMYLSIAITGMSIIVAIVTLYSGVRNSIISIGRNPLSKKSIFRGLLEIILTAFLILIIGLFAVYLLLKL